MASCKDFLELYRLCRLAATYTGVEYNDIPEDYIEYAGKIDTARNGRPNSCATDGHSRLDCHYCVEVQLLVEGLAARLESCGCPIPKDLL